MSGPRLVVLLPVRNGGALLGAWLESVAGFADEVIALDDGSTDDTGTILEAHTLVSRVLTNPRRGGYAGWDDHANRTRLLAAVTPGDWVLFLDADERVAPDDALGLRALVDVEVKSGFAYGFQIHRATDELSRHDPAGRWVYRMFRGEAGQTFPEKKLHFVPIPTSIPRRRWLRTSIRFLHVATTSEADGARRVAKYRDADGEHRWQESYQHLADPPASLQPLPPRIGPVVLPIHKESRAGPALSVIVISRDDEERIERCVRSIVEQEVSEPFEVVVVTSGSDRTAAIVRAGFPTVAMVELDHPALPGEARNAGVAVATGDIIAFPSSHIELATGSLQARLEAHRDGWAMVTGPVINGNPTPAGWAAYFLDHSSLLPDRPSGELDIAPTRCSYVRFMLDQVGGFPEGVRAGEDTAVNLALWDRGFSAFRDAGAAEIHTSLVGDAGALRRKHHQRGRAWAAILLARYGSRGRVIRRAWRHLLWYAPRRLWRIHRNVGAWGDGVRRPYRGAWPLILQGVLAAWWGVIVGLARGLSVSSPGWRVAESERRNPLPALPGEEK